MNRSLFDRQLVRVRRRLFVTTLLSYLLWAWVVAVIAAVGWVMAESSLAPNAPKPLRWMVLGSLVLIATIVATILTWRRSPSVVSAALALDERFALKERVTTTLSLTPEETDSPAGQALLADVEAKLNGVRIAERFPIGLPRLAVWCLPLSVLAFGLTSVFWKPLIASSIGDDVLATSPLAKEDVEEQIQQLGVRAKAKTSEVAKSDSELIERIQQEIDKFARSPRESREEVRERIKDATAIEDFIRREQKERADRLEAFREAIKQQERLRRKNREQNKDVPNGPAEEALARGDLSQVADELQRLSRQLAKEDEKERLRRKSRDPMLDEEEKKRAEEELEKLQREQNWTDEDREKLEKLMERVENDLKRLSRNKEEKEQELRDLAQQGELDLDQLERELEQLEKSDEQMDKQELEQIAKEMGECKQCMKEGKNGEAAEKLSKAAEKLNQQDDGGEQDKALQQKLAQIQQVKRALCRSLEGGGGIGAGRRPEIADNETQHKDAVVPGEWDKGKTMVVGQGPLGGFQGPRKPAEMKEEIKQAVQEAPAAIDRQRLPSAASKMARGYFERVRVTEKNSKKE